MSETIQTPKNVKPNLERQPEALAQIIMNKFQEPQEPAVSVKFVEYLATESCQAVLDWLYKIKAPMEVIVAYQTFGWGNLFVKDSLQLGGKISEWNNQSAVEFVIDGLNALDKLGHRF